MRCRVKYIGDDDSTHRINVEQLGIDLDESKNIKKIRILTNKKSTNGISFKLELDDDSVEYIHFYIPDNVEIEVKKYDY